MKNNACPFCGRDISKHHPQCSQGHLPDPEDIRQLENKKKETDKKKLKNTVSALTNNSK